MSQGTDLRIFDESFILTQVIVKYQAWVELFAQAWQGSTLVDISESTAITNSAIAVTDQQMALL